MYDDFIVLFFHVFKATGLWFVSFLLARHASEPCTTALLGKQRNVTTNLFAERIRNVEVIETASTLNWHRTFAVEVWEY
jgi:hypothetical protein